MRQINQCILHKESSVEIMLHDLAGQLEFHILISPSVQLLE